MRDEPEGTLLQVFADVAVNHGGRAEFAKITRDFFSKMAQDNLFRIRCNILVAQIFS
jgi:undecaprenyl pyrophosphate synthase